MPGEQALGENTSSIIHSLKHDFLRERIRQDRCVTNFSAPVHSMHRTTMVDALLFELLLLTWW